MRFRHHWAVISGSIDLEDPSPLAAAWRELQEETTLTRTSLELMRQGKSYVLPDESIGREWTIHPFAFRLKEASEGGKGENGITIDWEHVDWKWYDPMQVEDSEKFGAVPRLAESLRRVWFEKDLGETSGAVLTDGLDRLKNDHQSGARQLAGVALQILREIIVKLDDQLSTDEWWAKVRFASWHIWKNGRESMGAAILSVLISALKSMEDTMSHHKEQATSNRAISFRDAIVEDLDRRIATRGSDAAQSISLVLVQYLRDDFASTVESNRPIRLVSLSESSTITHALRHVVTSTDFKIDLRILESRPLFEGVSLAGSLMTAHDAAKDKDDQGPNPKLKVTLYTDASAALASEDVDIVLIGADRIAASGAISNKTGSLPAVLSAKHVSPKARTVILSETEKVAPPGDAAAHVVEDNDPTQLLRAWESDFNSERIRSAACTFSNLVRGTGGGGSKPGGDDQSSPSAVVTGGGFELEIRNVFFEWIPPQLVDVYATESGLWTVADIQKHSHLLGADEERLFKDI